MSNVTTVTQPQNLAEMIREQVRGAILQTIPDEQIDGLVKKEWDSFFIAPPKQNHYDPVKPSEFENMVKKEVHAFFQERVTDAIKKTLAGMSVNVWNPDAEAQKALQLMVKAYAPAALEGLAERLAVATIQNFAQNQQHIHLNNGVGLRQW